MLLGAGAGRAGRCCSSARATTAATRSTPASRCAARGARVDRGAARPGPGPRAGLAALRRGGGRVVGRTSAGSPRSTGADLVLDGIVGIGGRGGLRDPAPRAGRGGRAGRRRRRSSPSTCPAASTPTPARSTARTSCARPRPSRSAPASPASLVGRGAGAAGRCTLVDIGLGPDLPAPPVDVLGAADVGRGAGRGPGPTTTSTPAAWSGVARRLGDLPGRRACSPPARRVLAPAGMVRYAGAAARRRSAPRCPRWSPRRGVGEAGRVQAWVGRPGPRHRRRRRRALADGARPRTSRCVRRRRRAHPAGRSTPSCARRPDAPTVLLTPHAGEFARLAAPRSAPTARRRPRAGRRRSASPCCSRARHGGRRPGRTGAACTPTGTPGWPPPAPATCWPGIAARCSPPGWSRWSAAGVRGARARAGPADSPPTAAPTAASRLACPRPGRPPRRSGADRRRSGCEDARRDRRLRAEARVDLDAIAHNVAGCVRARPGAAMMAVVKADGYGHGLVHVARAALAGGRRPGSASALEEALALRAAGIDGAGAGLAAPCPARTSRAAVAADVDLGGLVARGARPRSRRPRGAPARPPGAPQDRHRADAATARRPPTGRRCSTPRPRPRPTARSQVVGVWSHLAYADEPDHPTIDRAGRGVRRGAGASPSAAGLRPEVRHLANSAATLTAPGPALRPRPARASRSTGSTRSADPRRTTSACARR